MIDSHAAIAHSDGTFSVEPVTVNKPGPGEALVELKASGVCHTDYDSMHTWKRDFILGHEGAGVVLETGDGVTEVEPGDRVILTWAISCGRCLQCNLGNIHICENYSPVTGPHLGGHAHVESTLWNGKPIDRSFNLGTMSNHTVVREEALVKIDVDIPFTSACIIGCGVMTGFGSVANAANVQTGSSVVVLGAGGVGLNVIQSARLAGAAAVIAVDVNRSRLAMANQFGATHCIQADREDKNLLQASEKVKALTAMRGADYAFECTAIPELGDAPLRMVRNAGMAVQVSGIEQTIAFDAELFEWDKIYINPLYGKCRPKVDFPKILKLYENKQYKIDELVTRTYSLNELGQAFEDMLQGRNAKGVISLEAS
ncbi:MAG: alcohol dehydrogenase catalytic domain-containing protein [Candidatus Hinthialibacter antarcticus]|nr:alcohol dehydrogenase catalytic domain-containing protein [Candidatus Hinthialibacter antarcticus]